VASSVCLLFIAVMPSSRTIPPQASSLRLRCSHSTRSPANRSSFCSGLDFTAQALRHNLTHPNEELSTSFREAYGKTLKQYHSFLIKPIFSAAMGACPYRKDFYAKLGDNPADVQRGLQSWLEALEERVKILQAFLATKEAKW